MGMDSLKKNVLYQTAYKLLISAAPLLTAPYLSRVLGAANLGIFSYQQSVINLFMLFAMLGISTYGVRTVASARKENADLSKTFWSIYVIQLFSSAAMIVLYIVYIILFRKDNSLIAWVFTLYLIGDLLDVSWFFFGVEEINITAIRGMIIKILSVFAVFILVRTSKDIWKYALIVAGGTALGQIIIWPAFLKRVCFYLPKWYEIKIHVKPMLILFIPLVAISVYHIMDKVMLGIISDDLNSGYYYNADKVINIPIVIITGIHAVFLPRISNMIAIENNRKQTKTFQTDSMLVTAALTCSMAFGIAAVSNEFIPVFFGEGYEPCVSLVKVFAFVMIAKAYSSALCNLYIIPTKNDKIYVISVLCGASINFLANIILMYFMKLGAMGATIGTLLSEGAVACIDLVMSNKRMKEMKIIKNTLNGWFFFIAGIIMYFAVRGLRITLIANASNFVALPIEIVSGVLVYGLFLWIYSVKTHKNIFSMILSSKNGR